MTEIKTPIDRDWTYQPISNPKYSSNHVTIRGINNMINRPPFCIIKDENKERYVCMEIAGQISLFSSPQYDARHSVSTRVPSPSAIRGIFESIFFSKEVPVKIIPTKVEICSLGDQAQISLNYNGQYQQFHKKGTAAQYYHSVYTDVCYKLWARVENLHDRSYRNNPKHLYQSYFFRNLYNYKYMNMPFLGKTRYITHYYGPIRNSSIPINESFKESALLLNHWSKPIGGKSFIAKNPEKVERINVEVHNGVCHF